MYNQFYGFTEKPFNVTPDPKFLFLTESHQKALEAVLYGIGERKGFVSISGEAGTGKTTILHYLLETLDQSVKTVFIAQTQVTPKQLLKAITQRLGLAPKDQSKISLINQLNEHLLASLSRGDNLAVLIDEAQNLSAEALEELRMLSNLETHSSKMIQIVLAGQPELEDKLNSRELRQLKQRIAIRSQIRSLTEEESHQYIDYRLRLVGKTIAQIFSPEAAALIVRHAEGVPRTLNLLCDNALLIGYRRKERQIPVAVVSEVLSDRGLAAEEKGNDLIDVNADLAPLPEEPIRKSPAKAIYLAIPAAALLILFFLAATGPLSFLWEKVKFRLAKIEAVATPEKEIPASPVQPETQIPSPPASSLADRIGEETAGAGENAKTPKDVLPGGGRKPEMRLVAVEKGETLYSVLRRQYDQAHTTLLDYVLSANPEISNPHQVKPGTRIRIPALVEESLIQPSSSGGFQMHLATFARKEVAQKYKAPKPLEGRNLRIESHRISPLEIWYRVFAVGYKSEEEALDAAKGLREKGLHPLFPPRS